MAKFTYHLALGWPCNHASLKGKLTKYTERENLTLSSCHDMKI